jgi:hypothetical protein
MNIKKEKEKKVDRPAAIKTVNTFDKTFDKTGEPVRNYDSTEQKKPSEEPLATKTPEVSRNIPVEKGSEV